MRRSTIRCPMPAPSDTQGAKHVELALRDLEFPTSKSQLLARAGHWRIPLDGAHFVELRELLEPVGEERFRSGEDVADALR